MELRKKKSIKLYSGCDAIFYYTYFFFFLRSAVLYFHLQYACLVVVVRCFMLYIFCCCCLFSSLNVSTHMQMFATYFPQFLFLFYTHRTNATTFLCYQKKTPLSSLQTFNIGLDNIISNNEHFHLNGNTLKIKNAQKHLAGYYNCIIAFGQSGAKLETPYELLIVNGKCIFLY